MRYLKPVKSTWGPRNVAALAVNLVDSFVGPKSSAAEQVYDEGGIAWATRRRDRWRSGPASPRVDPSDLWADLVARLTPRAMLYVACESVSDFLIAGGVYSRISAGEVLLPGLRTEVTDGGELVAPGKQKRRACLIVGGVTEIVRFTVGGCWCTLVGAGNYVGRSLESVYRDAAAQRGGDWPRRVELGLHRTDAAARAELLLSWFTRSASWWIDNDCGPWRDTAANLSHSLFRRRHLTTKILKDDHELQHRIARAGLFGGRASQWCYAPVGFATDDNPDPAANVPATNYPRVPGPVYHLDCRSIYASILRDQRFPIRFLRVDTRATVESLKRDAKRLGAIANVQIEAKEPEYPFRRNVGRTRDSVRDRDAKRRAGDAARERTDYPTGTFWTTLAGPELLRAIAEKSVRAVHGAAYYELGAPFQSFASELLDRRRAARRSGDLLGEGFAKLLINAFAGKFAQRAGGWTFDPDTPSVADWGEWSVRNADSGTLDRFRSIAGITQRYAPDDGEPKGIPQIFAYLTSYGRVMMRDIRAACPARSVLSQDTDSLWLTEAGYRAVLAAGLVHADEPGRLRLIGTYRHYRGWSPRHYHADGKWTLAGLSAGWMKGAGSEWIDTQRRPYAGLGSHVDGPQGILTVRRRVMLSSCMALEPVGPDGWVVPVHIGNSPHADQELHSAASSPPVLFPKSGGR